MPVPAVAVLLGAVTPVAAGGPPTMEASQIAKVDAAGTTGITITKPTGVVTGSVLYALIGMGDDAGHQYTCSGWTEIRNGSASTGTDRSFTILRKVITNGAGEPADYTFVNTNAGTQTQIGAILRIEGANTATPEDVVSAATMGVDNTNPATDAVNAAANTLAIAFLVLAAGNLTAITTGAPSGWAMITSDNIASVSDLIVAVAEKDMVAAGSTGTDAWTNTAGSVEENGTCTFTVAPA